MREALVKVEVGSIEEANQVIEVFNEKMMNSKNSSSSKIEVYVRKRLIKCYTPSSTGKGIVVDTKLHDKGLVIKHLLNYLEMKSYDQTMDAKTYLKLVRRTLQLVKSTEYQIAHDYSVEELPSENSLSKILSYKCGSCI